MNKKGDISLNYIIIAIIALIVLVVAVLFFSGAAQKIVEQLRGVSSGVPEQIKASWKSQCELACVSCDRESYNNLHFSYNEDGVAGTWSCDGTYSGSTALYILGAGSYDKLCGSRCNTSPQEPVVPTDAEFTEACKDQITCKKDTTTNKCDVASKNAYLLSSVSLKGTSKKCIDFVTYENLCSCS